MTPKSEHTVDFKRWDKAKSPDKILVMRFQALGDTVITLPYLQDLKRKYPDLIIHFFTREEVSPIPRSIGIFDKVITLRGKRNIKIQLLLALWKLPFLWCQRYDVVIDLQNHSLSRWIRKFIHAPAWSSFDKYSSASAALRTKATIEAASFWKVELDTKFNVKSDAEKILIEGGWKNDHMMLVLNPAGAFASRNWPIDHYISFAKLWIEKIENKTQFVLLLLPSLAEKAEIISRALGKNCINLSGKANQVEAFAILRLSSFMLTEDSGLMHMSWVQGIPTIALFSSSRKDWSAPQGGWSVCLDSSDLECGPCSLVTCQFGDNRCIARYTPEKVLAHAQSLLTAKVLT